MPAADRRRPSLSAPPPDLRLLPALVLIGAVTFNAVLAIVNAQVTALSPAMVIMAEIALVGAAHALALANYKREMTPWYLLIALLTSVALLRCLFMGEIDVKYLRDLLIIPTFILLGMTFDGRRLTGVVVALHALIMAVLLFEGFATEAYTNLFKIQDYYINTRGNVQDDFWNTESGLFASATRPDERFFGFVDLHRLSSIFLEPVSLGNYCIIVTTFVAAFFDRLTLATRAFLIGGTALMLIGCDGRLAMLSSLAIVLAAAIAPWLPPYSAVVYLPAVTVAAFLLVGFAGFTAGGDDFPGRIAHTVELLRHYDVPDLFGISNEHLSSAVDSGLAYLVITQSVFGVAMLWLFIVFAAKEDTAAQTRHTHALCVYLALTMMISFSFLSIKTAALLWFVRGSLQGSAALQRRSARESAAGRFVPERPPLPTLLDPAAPVPRSHPGRA